MIPTISETTLPFSPSNSYRLLRLPSLLTMSLKWLGVFLDCLTPRMEVMWYDAVRIEEGKPWVLDPGGICGREPGVRGEESDARQEGVTRGEERAETNDVDVVSVDGKDAFVSADGSFTLDGVLLREARERESQCR